jgi:DNA-directed RNA polymerase specialized sigma24 family protein
VSVPARFLGADPGRALQVAEGHLRELEGPVVRAVKGRLFRENVWLAAPDIEAAYNQAWHGVYEAMTAGREVKNLTGLLIAITYMRSIDIYRQRHEAQQADESLEQQTVEIDLAEHVDDQQTINGLLARLSERLNEKEKTAIALCLLRGYPRAQTATQLGLSEQALKKVMDSANKKLAGVVAMMQARGCGDDEWAGALRAHALGTMDPDSRDQDRVERHLQDCQACKRYVVGLRGLSVVLPPFLPLAHDPTLAARLQQLLTSTHPAGSGASAAAGAGNAAAAATSAASSTGAVSGGGITSVLGSTGLVKAAAITATVLAAGSIGLAVHVSGHHAKPPAPASARSAPEAPASVPLRLTSITPAKSTSRHASRSRPHKSASRPQLSGHSSGSRATATQSSAAGVENGEFRFERQPSEITGSTATPSPPASNTSAPSSAASRASEEFGAESHG